MSIKAMHLTERLMRGHLRRLGHGSGRERIRRLMRKMGLESVFQKPM